MTTKPKATPRRRRRADRPAFVVRPARPRDARSLVDLWRLVVAERRFVRAESVAGSLKYYRRRLRHSWTEAEASLVAVERRRIIGHLEVSREESPATRHIATVGMAVRPDRRGMGVGSSLMREAIGWARAMGVEKLALSVYPENEAARALYRKFDFQEEGRLTGHSKKSFGYQDEIVMGLWLIPRPASNTP